MGNIGCVTFIVVVLTVCLIVSQIGWPGLILLFIGIGMLNAVLNLLFGAHRP